MTVEEKLNYFYSVVIEDATKQSSSIMENYELSFQKLYDTHKIETLRKAEFMLQVEAENTIRKKNKILSEEILAAKHQVKEKAEQLTLLLFDDVVKKLEQYMQTPDYIVLLETQIKEAYAFAKGEAIIIYINTSDADKKIKLEEETGIQLTISTIPFMGGIRSVIHDKHILIDSSFSTKLEELKQSFTL